jgi:phytoene dehydrogenase-like protein
MVRVLVIGAGHQGLVCAIRLAAAGAEVTVLEHADHAGGALRSSADTLPGFVHDPCSGFLPLTAASPSFAGLGVRERVEWVNAEVPMAHPFLDGPTIALHRDVAATAASLERVARGAGAGWSRQVAPLLEHGRLVRQVALTPFPPVLAGAALAAHLRRDGIELARRMTGSAATFGLEVLGDRRPAAWLCGSAVHSDLSPGDPASGAFAFFLNLLGHMVGWPFPRGGAGRLTDALVDRLGELGGEVRCGAHVEEIVVRDGRAGGVRLAGGEELRGDAVVGAVTARPLLAMLPPGALPAVLMGRLRTFRYGTGVFKLDLALDGPVPWTSPEARAAAVVHVGDTVEAQQRSQEEAGRGEPPAEPSMVVGQHTVHDATRAPAGKHTLYAYTHVPQDVGIPDDAMADRMEERIEAFAPGFRRLVLARAVRSPRRFEEENPSLVGGDLGGGSFAIDQQLVFRPAPELFRGRTPLRGLYLAGSSVHPGGGVHGVSGTQAARALLADRAGWRPWRRV